MQNHYKSSFDNKISCNKERVSETFSFNKKYEKLMKSSIRPMFKRQCHFIRALLKNIMSNWIIISWDWAVLLTKKDIMRSTSLIGINKY